MFKNIMFFQINFIAKTFEAHRTLELLYSSMPGHMAFESALVHKSFLANGTSVSILILVYLYVFFERTLRCEVFATNHAPKLHICLKWKSSTHIISMSVSLNVSQQKTSNQFIIEWLFCEIIFKIEHSHRFYIHFNLNLYTNFIFGKLCIFM